MTKIRKIFLTGAAVSIAGAISLTAYASSIGRSPAEAAAGATGKTVDEVISERQDTGKTFGEIAKDAGDLEEFKEEMLELKKDALAQKVIDGKLTQEEADEILSAIEENAANCDGTGSAKNGQNQGTGSGMGGGNCANGTEAGNGNGSENGGNYNGPGPNGSGTGNRIGNKTGNCINQ